MSYGAAPALLAGLTLAAEGVGSGVAGWVGLLPRDSVVVELSLDQPGALAEALVTGSAIDGAVIMVDRSMENIAPENGRTRVRLTLPATILTQPHATDNQRLLSAQC
jgi:hypothetical protein